MDDDFDLSDFPGVTRLFPLPGVVLFPRIAIPLHIFEPRYRQMAEHALAGDRLITIVQIRPDADAETDPRPPLEQVACLGRIIQHERLPDGRFNILLAGLRRVELLRELGVSTLYRQAEVAVWEDEQTGVSDAARVAELVDQCKLVVRRYSLHDAELARLLAAEPSLGTLTDVMVHALGLPGAVKQSFLDERDPFRRAEQLLGILAELSQAPDRPVGAKYPPPVSLN